MSRAHDNGLDHFLYSLIQYSPACVLTSRSSPEGIPSGLTEVAIDDFARAKQTVTIGLDTARAE